jgi:hypothetical protein
MERLLEAHKEDREDQGWIRIAEERLERPEKTYSLEEVARALDLEVRFRESARQRRG